METLQVVAIVLTAIGALNWGLVGLAKFDLVAALTGGRFGSVNAASRLVYLLVVAAAVAGVRDRLCERPVGSS